MRPWCELETDAVLQMRDIRALDDGAVVCVSDFPPGRCLRGWMAEEPRMGLDEVVELTSGLLRGLVQVHAAELVHGDIKPASIWFEPGAGRGTLVDAGVTPGMWAAKHLGTRTALIGTPYYAPIEQFSGDSPDALSDQYNLGTVMYELLTGVLPWTGKGYIEVFQSKMQEAPPAMRQMAPTVEVPRALEDVVARSLRAKRRERFASAADFLSALESVELERA
jgi:serine/threonine-protein kinase